MRNTLDIDTTGEALLACLNDGTNRLIINGNTIPASQWVGAGSYTDTIEGHSITITKASADTGNIQLVRTASYSYQLLQAGQ